MSTQSSRSSASARWRMHSSPSSEERNEPGARELITRTWRGSGNSDWALCVAQHHLRVGLALAAGTRRGTGVAQRVAAEGELVAGGGVAAELVVQHRAQVAHDGVRLQVQRADDARLVRRVAEHEQLLEELDVGRLAQKRVGVDARKLGVQPLLLLELLEARLFLEHARLLGARQAHRLNEVKLLLLRLQRLRQVGQTCSRPRAHPTRTLASFWSSSRKALQQATKSAWTACEERQKAVLLSTAAMRHRAFSAGSDTILERTRNSCPMKDMRASRSRKRV
eukprot:6198590-Pleurochrysis_carterae.AAC.2